MKKLKETVCCEIVSNADSNGIWKVGLRSLEAFNSNYK